MRIEIAFPSPHGHQVQKTKALMVEIRGEEQLARPKAAEVAIDRPHAIGRVADVRAVPNIAKRSFQGCANIFFTFYAKLSQHGFKASIPLP